MMSLVQNETMEMSAFVVWYVSVGRSVDVALAAGSEIITIAPLDLDVNKRMPDRLLSAWPRRKSITANRLGSRY